MYNNLSFLIHGLDNEGHPDEGVREEQHRQEVWCNGSQHYLHRYNLMRTRQNLGPLFSDVTVVSSHLVRLNASRVKN